MRRDRPTGGRGTAATCLLLTVCLGATLGCTMCPSPFDYSGTVPGAADQNDFRVRNNGILPIWQRPRPWPPVVSNDRDAAVPAAGPRAVRQIPATKVAAAEPPATTSVLLTAAEESPPAAGRIGTASHAAPLEADATAEPGDADDQLPTVTEPRPVAAVPPVATD